MANKNEPQLIAPADRQESELAGMIKQGYGVIRIENDVQSGIATLKPRDVQKVMKNLITELELCPEIAQKMYYSLPFQKTLDDGSKKTEWVEGVSIKGAMTLQRCWGNSASAVRVVGEEGDKIICEGAFMDYETNNRVMRQVAVSRFFRTKKNEVIPLRHDKLEMAIASGQSKAVRNAINNGLPLGLLTTYFNECKRVAASTKGGDGKLKKAPLAERWAALKADYNELGVTDRELAEYVGTTSVSEKEYERLAGLLNAIQEDYVSIETVFKKEAKEEKKVSDTVDIKNIIK